MYQYQIIFTNGYPSTYKVFKGSDIQFNWAERTAQFRELDSRKMITISVEDIDYITVQP